MENLKVSNTVDLLKFIFSFIVLGHTSGGYIHWFCFSFNSVIFVVLSGMTFCRIKNEKDGLIGQQKNYYCK